LALPHISIKKNSAFLAQESGYDLASDNCVFLSIHLYPLLDPLLSPEAVKSTIKTEIFLYDVF